jgi:hypothetical protein
MFESRQDCGERNQRLWVTAGNEGSDGLSKVNAGSKEVLWLNVGKRGYLGIKRAALA